jgi:hypothetical protein
MPRERLKPTIPVFERVKTVNAFDRAATVIGHQKTQSIYICHLKVQFVWQMYDTHRDAQHNYGEINQSFSQTFRFEFVSAV